MKIYMATAVVVVVDKIRKMRKKVEKMGSMQQRYGSGMNVIVDNNNVALQMPLEKKLPRQAG